MSFPLVSVIIPCYNHAHFLSQAVDSVKKQTYAHTEIIVVDDGSTDDTRIVCAGLAGIRYVYQENKGLSSARNTGFSNCRGEYVVFLDADDYLYPEGIAINLKHLLKDETLAFVSGGHKKVDVKGLDIHEDHHAVIESDHYLHLLQGNYIGMHATVMYPRWVLNEFQFDTKLKACEDYDMYFRITRKYPVANHTEKIAVYRIHYTNMSGNIPFMLEMALKVQGAQKPFLRNEQEQEAFRKGIIIWKEYYSQQLYDTLLEKVIKLDYPTDEELASLEKISHSRGAALRKRILKQKLKGKIKKYIPDFVKSFLYKRRMLIEYTPGMHNVNWGDLERSKPFSTSFGYDRGGPVDRYYIEKFLQQNKNVIRGRAFEIGDNAYTLQFGGDQVKQSDVLHVYKANESVTFIGDLTDAPHIPSDAFDCIILTQTLHLIYDFKAALRTCYRILKPGGALLLTVPGITQIDQDEWKEFWLWAFTTTVMNKIFKETFPGATLEIKSYGNVYVASAFLYGMGLPEVRKDLLDKHDPSYQVIISVKATKAL